MLGEEKEELFYEIHVGKSAAKAKSARLKIGEGIPGRVAKHGKPIMEPNLNKEKKSANSADSNAKTSGNSVVCVPLKVRHKVLGVIELVNKQGTEPFTDHDTMILTTLADYAAIALENSKRGRRYQ